MLDVGFATLLTLFITKDNRFGGFAKMADIQAIISKAKNTGGGVRELAHMLSNFCQNIDNSSGSSGSNLNLVFISLISAIAEVAVEFRQSGHEMDPTYDFCQLGVAAMLNKIMDNFIKANPNKVKTDEVQLISNIFRLLSQMAKVGGQRKAMVQIGVIEKVVSTMNTLLDSFKRKKKKESNIDNFEQAVFWSCNALFFICINGADINKLVAAGGLSLTKRLASLVENDHQNATHIGVLQRIILIGVHNSSAPRTLKNFSLHLQVEEKPI